MSGFAKDTSKQGEVFYEPVLFTFKATFNKDFYRVAQLFADVLINKNEDTGDETQPPGILTASLSETGLLRLVFTEPLIVIGDLLQLKAAKPPLFLIRMAKSG